MSLQAGLFFAILIRQASPDNNFYISLQFAAIGDYFGLPGGWVLSAFEGGGRYGQPLSFARPNVFSRCVS
jgi:hypothetical protein